MRFFLASLFAFIFIFPSIARAITLQSASPHLVKTDTPVKGKFSNRVTFSPDGDKVHDLAVFQVSAPKGYAVRLEVYRWYKKSFTHVQTKSWQRTVNGQGTLFWGGMRQFGGSAPDGSYLIQLCQAPASEIWPRIGLEMPIPDETTFDENLFLAPTFLPKALHRTCLTYPIVAHLRRLAAGIKSAGSFLPGQTVNLSLQTDKRYIKAEIYPDLIRPGTKPLFTKTIDRTKTQSFVLPQDLTGGLYRLRISDLRGNFRLVPLIVRRQDIELENPPHHTALIVWPYMTWRAYNSWDDDRNAIPDTWYALITQTVVNFTGPYENYNKITPGAESNYNMEQYFMEWLDRPEANQPRRNWQTITDVELAALPDEVLEKYSAVIYPGHTEYYPQELYDKVKYYRDHGGKMLFLSANGFYRRVILDPATNKMHMDWLVARSEAQSDYALLGVGYIKSGFPPSAYRYSVVTNEGLAAVPWLFENTDIGPYSQLGLSAYEVDNIDPILSPPQTVAVTIAELPVGVSSIMGYTPFSGGGEILATGNLAFVTWLSDTDPFLKARTTQMLDNAWIHLVTHN